MLNNLTNFANIIKRGMIKKTLSDTDLIALSTKDKNYDGGYKPTAISAADLKKSFGQHLDTTLFAYPFSYVVTPVMTEGIDTITGDNFFFGNTVNLKSYKILGKIAVGTNFNLWPIGTISANVPLNGDLPWKVTGVVEAFDDVTGNYLQTGFADGARVADTAGGTVNADFCTIMEDYNSTPGSIELYLAVASSFAVGDIYGNVAFEYEIYVDESINLVFTV
jgi:hypothetical protein